ncbi:MAG: type II secretion system protein [Lentisphaerae bacterium]|nr:type II secretion system protein [Lentisphaerota bacterium]
MGKRHSAFTLIELLTVVVILGILFGLVTSAVMRARLSARRRKAATDCITLAAAARSHYHRFGEWPVPDPYDANGIRVYLNSNYKVMACLLSNELSRTHLSVGDYAFDAQTNVLSPAPASYPAGATSMTVTYGAQNVTMPEQNERYTFVFNKSDRAQNVVFEVWTNGFPHENVTLTLGADSMAVTAFLCK